MAVLKVEGMHCNKCVERINKGLQDAGIEVLVCLEEKTVTVNGDEVTVDKVIDELDDLGFEAIRQ